MVVLWQGGVNTPNSGEGLKTCPWLERMTRVSTRGPGITPFPEPFWYPSLYAVYYGPVSDETKNAAKYGTDLDNTENVTVEKIQPYKPEAIENVTVWFKESDRAQHTHGDWNARWG